MLSTFEFDFCMIILMSDLITAPRPYSDEELAELELQEHAYTDEEKEELNAGKRFCTISIQNPNLLVFTLSF